MNYYLEFHHCTPTRLLNMNLTKKLLLRLEDKPLINDYTAFVIGFKGI
jgi:hypothetical protein